MAVAARRAFIPCPPRCRTADSSRAWRGRILCVRSRSAAPRRHVSDVNGGPGTDLRAGGPGAKKAPAKAWTAPKTGWGDPDLSGVYTNNDESLIPFERPAEFAGRKLEDVTRAELEKLIDERDAQRAEADRNRAELRSPLHWFENLFPNNSRAWLVSDPADGKVPPLTPEAQQRNAARARERAARGPADSYEDRSLYDRCISRGIPGSMMPAIYGNAYEIVQGPGYVAITYEMVHEARVIPLTSARTPANASGCIWATRKATGRATLSSSRRRTSRTRSRIAVRAST